LPHQQVESGLLTTSEQTIPLGTMDELLHILTHWSEPVTVQLEPVSSLSQDEDGLTDHPDEDDDDEDDNRTDHPDEEDRLEEEDINLDDFYDEDDPILE